jgi:hypothetical protein
MPGQLLWQPPHYVNGRLLLDDQGTVLADFHAFGRRTYQAERYGNPEHNQDASQRPHNATEDRCDERFP